MTTIKTELYTGNFVCGLDTESEGINLEKSVHNYCREVERELPEYKIEWEVKTGEGSPKSWAQTEDDPFWDGNANEIEDLKRSEEFVFNRGTFWAMKEAAHA